MFFPLARPTLSAWTSSLLHGYPFSSATEVPGVEDIDPWALWSSSPSGSSHDTFTGSEYLKYFADPGGCIKLQGGSVSQTHLLAYAAPRSAFYKIAGQCTEGLPCFSYFTSPTLTVWWAAFTLKFENIPALAR